MYVCRKINIKNHIMTDKIYNVYEKNTGKTVFSGTFKQCEVYKIRNIKNYENLYDLRITSRSIDEIQEDFKSDQKTRK